MNLSKAQVKRFRKHPRELVGTWWELYWFEAELASKTINNKRPKLLEVTRANLKWAELSQVGVHTSWTFLDHKENTRIPLSVLLSPMCGLVFLGHQRTILHLIAPRVKFKNLPSRISQSADYFCVTSNKSRYGDSLLYYKRLPATLRRGSGGSLKTSIFEYLFSVRASTTGVGDKEWNRAVGFCRRVETTRRAARLLAPRLRGRLNTEGMIDTAAFSEPTPIKERSLFEHLTEKDE